MNKKLIAKFARSDYSKETQAEKLTNTNQMKKVEHNEVHIDLIKIEKECATGKSNKDKLNNINKATVAASNEIVQKNQAAESVVEVVEEEDDDEEEEEEIKEVANNQMERINELDCLDIKDEHVINNMKRSSSTLTIKATTSGSDTTTTTTSFSSIHSSTSCSSPTSSTTLLPSSGKRRRLWQMTDLVSDDESLASFDSMLDIETRSTTQTTPLQTESGADDTATGSCDSSLDCCDAENCSGCSETGSSCTSATAASDQTFKKPQYLYYTTKSPYMSRPWQEEELDGDLEDDIAEALRSAEPKLEIPKWTEHDITPLYSIEGTEDLSDDIFLKRHAKLELDEKRRKKWDVQQIREQRRLEKLRKRHCKDELNQGPVIQSFFPLNEDLETICFVDTLPVQAFGEPIPILPHNGEGFLLPWLLETDGRPLPPPKKATEFYRFGLKKMTRREEKLWEEYLDEVEDGSQDVDNIDLKQKDECLDIKEENTVKEEEVEENGKAINEDIEKHEMISDIVKEEVNKTTSIATATTTNENNICDNENTTKERTLRIADCCYASPTVVLAKKCRPCASRTQQRRRLRYSSYIYLTKRRRQLSMSTTNTRTTTACSSSNFSTTTTTATGTTATTSSSPISLSSSSTLNSTPTSTTTMTNSKNTITIKTSSQVKVNISTVARPTASTRKTTRQNNATTITNNNNTHNTSNTTTIAIGNDLDKTKENNTTITSSATNTNACAASEINARITTTIEKSEKTVQGLMSIVTTGTTTATTTLTTQNSIKSKLRNLRSSSSPNSHTSSSNSSTNILDNPTTTTTSSLSITTPTLTSVTETKTK